MPSRHIPATTRKELRREVNWGCPIDGCGNPFLSYHHFAPPFREFTGTTTHHPDGIIGLCLNHAGKADGGAFTDDQLRDMKRNPFLRGDRVEGRNDWLRRNTVLRAGTNTFVNIASLVTVDGQKVIWFDRGPQGYLQLSMNIGDAQGNPLFVMENNDWMVSGPLNDLEAKPRGRELIVKSQSDGFWMKLGFKDLDEPSFRSEIEELELEKERRRIEEYNALMAALRVREPENQKLFVDDNLDEAAVRHHSWNPFALAIDEWPALEVTFEGELPAPIKLVSSHDDIQVGGIRMTGSIAVGSITVFSFKS